MTISSPAARARRLANQFGWREEKIALYLDVTRLTVTKYLTASTYDAELAAKRRRQHKDFERDPVWLGMRPPGSDS